MDIILLLTYTAACCVSSALYYSHLSSFSQVPFYSFLSRVIRKKKRWQDSYEVSSCSLSHSSTSFFCSRLSAVSFGCLIIFIPANDRKYAVLKLWNHICFPFATLASDGTVNSTDNSNIWVTTWSAKYSRTLLCPWGLLLLSLTSVLVRCSYFLFALLTHFVLWRWCPTSKISDKLVL